MMLDYMSWAGADLIITSVAGNLAPHVQGGHGMDDLIAQISEKTGVTFQQAKEGVAISAAWVREKLPSDVAEQLGGLLDGAGDLAAGAVGKAKDAGASVTSTAGSVAESGADTASSAWEKTKDSVSDFMPGNE
jgi:hypothetical protein